MSREEILSRVYNFAHGQELQFFEHIVDYFEQINQKYLKFK